MTTPSPTDADSVQAAAGGTDAAPPSPPLAAQPFVRPPPSQSFDPAAVFMEAYECAKLNNAWNKVASSLMIHPEWLTKIPEGRRWTMLHQIVFSGNVMHLNEVLALQASNPQFRLLSKTLDDKTVREVAAERAHIHPQMMRRIERLVAVDQLLTNAKDRKWELVKQCISMQPDIVNEKPPYRRYYLAHHLACSGELEMFKELSTICQFKLDLLADNKTISQVARDNHQDAFAEHIDGLVNSQGAIVSDDPPLHHTVTSTHHSPGFYHDPGMSFIPANVDVATLILPTSASMSYSSTIHHMPAHPPSSAPVAAAPQVNSLTGAASTQPKPSTPQMTDGEQEAYEKTVISNIQKMSHEHLLNSITCCITKEILRDPVVAADGFTYERQAILDWFQHSNRSPMTNQELESTELKPNYAIKSILQMLHGMDTPAKAAEKK